LQTAKRCQVASWNCNRISQTNRVLDAGARQWQDGPASSSAQAAVAFNAVANVNSKIEQNNTFKNLVQTHQPLKNTHWNHRWPASLAFNNRHAV
jgi:hypothetical protein